MTTLVHAVTDPILWLVDNTGPALLAIGAAVALTWGLSKVRQLRGL